MRACRQQWRLYAYVCNCDDKNTVSQISTEIRCANVVTCEYVCLYLCCSRVCHQFACARVCCTSVRVDTSAMLCCKLCTVHQVQIRSSDNIDDTHACVYTCGQRHVCALKFAIVARWLEISSLSILTYFKSDEFTSSDVLLITVNISPWFYIWCNCRVILMSVKLY